MTNSSYLLWTAREATELPKGLQRRRHRQLTLRLEHLKRLVVHNYARREPITTQPTQPLIQVNQFKEPGTLPPLSGGMQNQLAGKLMRAIGEFDCFDVTLIQALLIDQGLHIIVAIFTIGFVHRVVAVGDVYNNREFMATNNSLLSGDAQRTCKPGNVFFVI